MTTSSLVFDYRLGGGGQVRVWRELEQGFFCEHLMPSGKGISIYCGTLNEAVGFWKRVLHQKAQGNGDAGSGCCGHSCKHRNQETQEAFEIPIPAEAGQCFSTEGANGEGICGEPGSGVQAAGL